MPDAQTVAAWTGLIGALWTIVQELRHRKATKAKKVPLKEVFPPTYRGPK